MDDEQTSVSGFLKWWKRMAILSSYAWAFMAGAMMYEGPKQWFIIWLGAPLSFGLSFVLLVLAELRVFQLRRRSCAEDV